jgi:superfamily I DNA/RNA helicase
MKAENGDFDMADFVNDLHLRLKTYKYEGDAMDFVYIDEVQDLTMRQIALFKHICRNVDEGFVFCGDTAQTIARGIDFRFEDIRSLFYKEFVLVSRSAGNDRNEKGQISKIFHLNQNFRTHAGVLNLAQSVIDLLYRFFPSFIDVLSHETSLIYGEAPILLESGNDENAIVTIFGNSGNVRSNFVGFGAEQVILVRDDAARKEIDNYVGKHALVLTVVECKGLEFQVSGLLYILFFLFRTLSLSFALLSKRVFLLSKSNTFDHHIDNFDHAPNFSLSIICTSLVLNCCSEARFR